MQNFNNIAVLIALLLLGGFQCKQREVVVPEPAGTPIPKDLTAILTFENPVDLYKEAYSSFRFSSQSVLTLTTSGQTKTMQGSSALEMDERGNYRLVRIPLTADSAVELIYLDQKAYLRLGSEKEFRVTRPLPEFQRWVTVSIREVFSLFEQAGFGKDSTPSIKKQLRCWSDNEGTICADPDTGLPVEGNIQVELKGGSETQVHFTIATAKHKAISIQAPKTLK